MTTLYTFDPKTREHTGERPASVVGGKKLLKSAYATTVQPPDVPEGSVARWTGSAWEIVEDHRQHTDEHGVRQGGTKYWLPEDTWQSQPRYMDELGPLPANALTVQPAKPAPTTEELFSALRSARDRRLTATDYLLMPDYPISAENKTVVEEYRQALRDLPAQDGAPWDGGGEETPWPSLSATLSISV